MEAPGNGLLVQNKEVVLNARVKKPTCSKQKYKIKYLPLFTLGSVYSTKDSGAEQSTGTNNSN